MFNQTFRIHFTIFGISIDKSFMPCEPISHPLKKNIFLRKVTKAHQKKASKTDIKDMPFNVTCGMVQNLWCDPCPHDEWCFCRSTTSHVSKVVNLSCKRMFYPIEQTVRFPGLTCVVFFFVFLSPVNPFSYRRRHWVFRVFDKRTTWDPKCLHSHLVYQLITSILEYISLQLGSASILGMYTGVSCRGWAVCKKDRKY